MRGQLVKCCLCIPDNSFLLSNVVRINLWWDFSVIYLRIILSKLVATFPYDIVVIANVVVNEIEIDTISPKRVRAAVFVDVMPMSVTFLTGCNDCTVLLFSLIFKYKPFKLLR